MTTNSWGNPFSELLTNTEWQSAIRDMHKKMTPDEARANHTPQQTTVADEQNDKGR